MFNRYLPAIHTSHTARYIESARGRLQDLDKVWAQKLGYNWDNFGDWNQAVQAAHACDGLGPYPPPVNQLSADEDQCDVGYYGAVGLRKHVLAYLSYKTAIGSHIFRKTTASGHGNQGVGLWFTPYLPTYDNSYSAVSPISAEPYLLA